VIDRINLGDQAALKTLLTAYTKPVYERTLARTGDSGAAKTATRNTLNEIMAVASRGQCPVDAEPWIMALADRFAAEEMLARGTAPARNPAQEQAWNPPDFVADWTPPDYITGWTPPDSAEPQKPAPGQANNPQTRNGQTRNGQTRNGQRRAVREAEPEELMAAEDVIAEFYDEKPAPRSRRPSYYDDEDELDELELFDEEEGRGRKKGGFGIVLLILLLGIVVVALVWMLAVMLMSRGVLPMADLGFAEWFNTNIFPLY